IVNVIIPAFAIYLLAEALHTTATEWLLIFSFPLTPTFSPLPLLTDTSELTNRPLSCVYKM
ncbi:hypothetical protein ARMGADRAFT_1020057, partial [Armillaria gallica]